MTKLEALAKDCIENHTHRLVDKPTKQDIYLREESIFIQGYRQSEKRIAELEKENAELKDDNKANEWHYVKDELPPVKKEYNGRSELVLVLSEEKEMQYAQYVEEEKTWARGIFEINFKPYAWKEIVLPELKESE